MGGAEARRPPNLDAAKTRPGAGRAHDAIATNYMAQPNGGQLREITALIEAGKVRPTVSKVLPLDQVQEAHRAVEQEHPRGKVVLQIKD